MICVAHRRAYLIIAGRVQERDSGWALSYTELNGEHEHNPLRVGCHIKLAREIMLKSGNQRANR